MDDLKKAAVSALTREADQLAQVMRHEVNMTMHGDAPGKPAWRDKISGNIGLIATVVTDDGISALVGYTPSSKAEEIRAMVVGYGSGDKADGGGKKIHAGPTGRGVWDDELSSKRPSRAKSEYDLPDAFNQKGNLFVDNAIRRMRGRYGDSVGQAIASLPSGFYFRKVRVRRP